MTRLAGSRYVIVNRLHYIIQSDRGDLDSRMGIWRTPALPDLATVAFRHYTLMQGQVDTDRKEQTGNQDDCGQSDDNLPDQLERRRSTHFIQNQKTEEIPGQHRVTLGGDKNYDNPN